MVCKSYPTVGLDAERNELRSPLYTDRSQEIQQNEVSGLLTMSVGETKEKDTRASSWFQSPARITSPQVGTGYHIGD